MNVPSYSLSQSFITGYMRVTQRGENNNFKNKNLENMIKDHKNFLEEKICKPVYRYKTITKLSPAEFNSYKLKSGEEFDNHEFTNAQKFYKEARPITKMLNKLRGIMKNIKKKPGSKMIMLTLL